MLTYATYTDNELALLIERGDGRAMTEVYKRYAELLYRQALQVLKDREGAKEALQEVFASYWKRHNQIHIQTNLHTYLCGAIRNQVIKRYAQKKRENQLTATSLEILSISDTCETDHPLREKELQMKIDTEIERLPRKMRVVFKKSRKEHLSSKEIAQELQISEDTVKSQIKNALRILRERLKYFITFFGYYYLFF